MYFKAAIFDLDGTLLDTLQDLTETLNAVLGKEGLPQHDGKRVKGFVGEGVETLILRALPEEKRDDEALTARCITQWREEYAKRWIKHTRPYEGIPDLLHALRNRGLALGVLSNKPHEPTVEIISRLLPGPHFVEVRGAMPDFPKKPDPTTASAMAGRLGVSPERILYLGDTAVDMKTAVGAGLYPVGALWGFREARELIETGARSLFPRPGDLLPWVTGA